MRLTKSVRETMATAMVKRAMAPRYKTLYQQITRLADKLYTNRNGEANLKEPVGKLKTVSALQVYLHGLGERYVRFGGGTSNRYGKNFEVERPDDVERPVWNKHTYRLQDLSPAEVEEAIRVYQEEDTLREQARAMYEKTLGTLSGFSTSEVLAKNWPEVTPFLPASAERHLPVVQREVMNKLLELPVVEAEGSK